MDIYCWFTICVAMTGNLLTAFCKWLVRSANASEAKMRYWALRLADPVPPFLGLPTRHLQCVNRSTSKPIEGLLYKLENVLNIRVIAPHVTRQSTKTIAVLQIACQQLATYKLAFIVRGRVGKKHCCYLRRKMTPVFQYRWFDWRHLEKHCRIWSEGVKIYRKSGSNLPLVFS